MESFDDLTEAILRRTSGSACQAAEALLCDLADGELAEPDRELVELHLQCCSGCAATARALGELRSALPSMAEVEPGRRFTEAVLARTSRSALRRLAGSFRQLLLRPAFAMEGAYLGSLVLVALVGFPAFQELPRRTTSAVQAVPASLRRTVQELSSRTQGLDTVVTAAVDGVERRASRVAVRVAELKHRVETKIDAVIAEPDEAPARSGSGRSEETP